MDQCKVCLVVGIDQIMVVLVDLHGRQLALVDNVLVGQGADVKPVVEADAVCSTLSKHVELSLKLSLVELLGSIGIRRVAGTVGRCENDEGLQDSRLPTESSRSQQRRVDRRLSPSEDSQIQRLSNVFQLPLLLLQCLWIRVEEQVAHSVLAWSWQLDTSLPLKVLREELERHRGHDTGTITISSIRTNGTTVGHVAKEVASIAHNLVACLALDVAVIC